MKKNYTNKILFILLFITSLGYSQTLLYTEDFETSGEGTRYNGTFLDGTDVMNQTNANPAPSYLNSLTGINGTGYIYSEDVDGAIGINLNHPTGTLTLNAQNISGKGGIQVSILLAEARADGRFEGNEKVEVQADIDGGGFTTIGRFTANGAPANPIAGGFLMAQDTDLNGVANGSTLNSTLTEYTFDVDGIGTNLTVRVVITTDGGSEEIAFDYIRIWHNIVLSTEDVELSNNLNVYPNPSNGDITVLNNSNKTLKNISVFDLNGRLIHKQTPTNSTTQKIILSNKVSSGMYILKLNSEDASIVKRILIK
ncbi:T9SS type A sorting domain-containing protein [Tenacibaculum aquimarinum]|uniref:T9SS type A sorting domain-containing protein n=1 Tax=Tenacibaculum aquimarinum TaxID=2910675 RepID=UPI001F0AD108|nr:T9SS type A sorting domain-containing protein [Tenacibaculum aquimarinum]MCH3884706.1 T9SS type A sorting domain-containing protein [Tenacibaculum aquimarinum]